MAYEQEHRNDPGRQTAGDALGTSGAPGAPLAAPARGPSTRYSDRVGPAHAHPEHTGDDSGPARIQHDIDRTRSQMDRTLDEMGERLQPSNLIHSVVSSFSGNDPSSASSGSRNAGSMAWQKVRDNPLAATGIAAAATWTLKLAARSACSTAWQKMRENQLATTGIAAAATWLLLRKDDGHEAHASRDRIRRNSREPRMYGGSYVDARTGQPYDVEHYGDAAHAGGRHEDSQGWTGRMAEYASEKAHEAADAARSAAGYVTHRAGDTASTTGEAVSHAGASAAESTRRGTSAAWDSTRSATGNAYGSSRQVAGQGYAYGRDRFDESLREHPLTVGVAALAAGVLAGLVVPRTRSENRYVGGYSRQMKDEASHLAHEAYDRGRHMAETGLETARSEAKRQGLSPEKLKGDASDLVEHTKEAASHVADAAVTSAKSAASEATDQAKSEADRLKSEASERGDHPKDLKEKAATVAESTKEAVKEDAQRQSDEMKREHSNA